MQRRQERGWQGRGRTPVLVMLAAISLNSLVPAATDTAGPALVKKALAALGGEQGMVKRRTLFTEQRAVIEQAGTGQPMTATVAIWAKGDKARMEQRIGALPGAAIVIIYDGKDLFLQINGQRRDPGTNMKKSFMASRKRDTLWWDLFKKKLVVKSLGEKELTKAAGAGGPVKQTLSLIEVTHSKTTTTGTTTTKSDTTVVGLDPTTSFPLYMQFKAPHPYTGKNVVWTQWQSEIVPMKEAEGLLFPRTVELYYGPQRQWTATTVKVQTKTSIPDSLFGKDRPVD